jgi:hypothetical protein
MPRVQLPPGCAGFSDGSKKYMAERGPGSFVNLDDTDPGDARALRKLRSQDYASAGLVDANPEKFYVRKGPEGRGCRECPDNTIWYSWTKICPSCGAETVPESEIKLPKLAEYIP